MNDDIIMSDAPEFSDGEAIVPIENFCISCLNEFKQGEIVGQFSCRHALHDNPYCIQRLRPFRCIFGCPPYPSPDPPPTLFKHLPRRRWGDGGTNALSHQPRPPTGNIQCPLVDTRDNPTMQLAIGLGLAFQRHSHSEDTLLPTFKAPKARVPPVDPREQVNGPVTTKVAVVQVSAVSHITIRRKGFVSHAAMDYKKDLIDAVVRRPDLDKFLLISEKSRPYFWNKFAVQHNWWWIPTRFLSNRSFARDIHECHWLDMTEKDMRYIHQAPQVHLAQQEFVSRYFHSFAAKVNCMKEAFWRSETGHWVSTHDVMWQSLSSTSFAKYFPRVSDRVLDLGIPVALAVPMPPTPFYYGVTMARLQKAAREKVIKAHEQKQLDILERNTLHEYMVLTVVRFHNEMRYGGRLYKISRRSIRLIAEALDGYTLNLPHSLPSIIRQMDLVHTLRQDLLNEISFKLPEWAIKKPLPLSQFIWSLVPTAQVNINAKHAQRIEQELEAGTRRNEVGAARPCAPFTCRLKRRLKAAEISEDPRLARFIEQEWDGTIPSLSVGDLLERLSVRAAEKIRDRGHATYFPQYLK